MSFRSQPMLYVYIGIFVYDNILQLPNFFVCAFSQIVFWAGECTLVAGHEGFCALNNFA